MSNGDLRPVGACTLCGAPFYGPAILSNGLRVASVAGGYGCPGQVVPCCGCGDLLRARLQAEIDALRESPPETAA